MSREIQGRILRGPELEDLDEYAIYDKIINVKFIREKPGNDFTLRSDYEVEQDVKGAYFFRKCTQKPDIRVEYRRVATNVMVGVKLYVTNLHLQSAQNTNEKYSVKNNKIDRVIIQMGYFRQFPRFDDPLLSYTLDDYYNLKTRKSQVSYLEMDCQVLGVYPHKLPPDGVTLFDCVIGSVSKSYHEVPKDKPDKFTLNDGLRAYLFENITRRFARKTVVVRDFDTVGKGTLTTKEGVVYQYDGKMTLETANNFGVKCILSNRLLTTPTRGPTVLPTLQPRNTVTETIYDIMNIFPDIRFYALLNGSYSVCHVEEKADAVHTALRLPENREAGGLAEETNAVSGTTVLPAVYSITYSGLRMIQCPFTTLVRPFQKMEFSTVYNLGNLVSYYYQPVEGQEAFFVINIGVNFSTTGEENMMEITSTDTEKKAT